MSIDTTLAANARAYHVDTEDSVSFIRSLSAIVRSGRDPRLSAIDVDELTIKLAMKDPTGGHMFEPHCLNKFGRPELRHRMTGMLFVLIPAGEFVMGSADGDSDEQPPHKVVLPRPALCGKFPITQGQWRKVMGANPSTFSNEKRHPTGDTTDWDNHPVETVSWLDAQEFLKKTGLQLPPEAGWEYACRAGTQSRFHAAGDDDPLTGGDTEEHLQKIAVFGRDYDQGHAEVGTKQPNSWGIYDCLGNAWEWQQDEYHSDYVDAPVELRPWDEEWDELRADLYQIAVTRKLLDPAILEDEHDAYYRENTELIGKVTRQLIAEGKHEYWRRDHPKPRTEE